MPVRHLLAVDAALLGAVGVAAQPDADVFTISAGRAGAFAAAVLGLAGVIVAVLALARPGGRFGTRTGTRGGIVPLVTGLAGIAIGGLVVATADAGIGTGNGRGGAYLALVLGAVSVGLGVLALTRSRRTSRAPS